jgi:ubiquinone/menaquinone biosynthesis C-methylase UbiE
VLSSKGSRRRPGSSSLLAMADPRSGFYRHVLHELIAEGVVDTGMSVLVSCGGVADRDSLADAGFTNVTITNVDGAGDDGALTPFAWEHQDAEALTCEDGSFDVGIVSAGLHHCRSPHRALLELYRVARVAVVALESRDSALMRLGVRLGAVDEYELGAVAAHGLRAGGVENTSTPNYVYRWTEREVAKTVASFAPHVRHRVRFFREFELPDVLVESARGPRSAVLRLSRPVIWAVARALPRQANLFAFVIEKPDPVHDLQPWMAAADEPDERVIGERYAIER